MTVKKSKAGEVFTAKMKAYKKLIDDDIAAYGKRVRTNTLNQYGANTYLETDAYLSILERGGKRIRGVLTMLGYEMSGGTDQAMIIQAARAIEMLHAYLLIIDDIQDRSVIRRGSPSAHIMLADYHRQHELAGDSAHFGLSVALNSAISGAHAAGMILANLEADELLRLNVVSIVNRTMMVTAHGQTNDIMNEAVARVTEQEVEKVLEWKTAVYSFLNPLHVGMVLAGADCSDTDAITGYATHAGKAFQITDDILGTFGSEFDSGKSPGDDIREGKRNMLTVNALERANNGNKNFLIQMLGNERLTPTQFERCKVILVECGALGHARQRAKDHIKAAHAALDKEAHRWNPEGVQFLQELANYLVLRQA